MEEEVNVTRLKRQWARNLERLPRSTPPSDHMGIHDDRRKRLGPGKMWDDDTPRTYPQGDPSTDYFIVRLVMALFVIFIVFIILKQLKA